MGVLDAVRAPRIAPSAGIGRLAKGQSLCIAVASDSTGVYQTSSDPRWPTLLSSILATANPNHRVAIQQWTDPGVPANPVLGQGSFAETVVQAGVAPAAATDAFARANGAPGTMDTGQSYQQVSNFTIASGKLTATAPGASLIVDPGSNDVAVTASVTFATSKGASADTQLRLTVRSTLDTTTQYFATFKVNDTGGFIGLFRRVRGGSTQVVADTAASALTYGGTATCTITVIRNKITVTAGATTISYTIPVADQHDPYLGGSPYVNVILTNNVTGMSINSLTIAPQVPRIDVWNSAASGMNPDYHRARIAQVMPQRPDMIIVNHSHNDAALSSQTYLRMVHTALSYWPGAQVFATLQNPRGASMGVAYAEGRARVAQVAHLAQREGWTPIDVYSAFAADPNYSTNLLSQTDGLLLHPNAAGSTLWAQTVAAHILPPNNAPVSSQRIPSRVFVPANQFYAVEGAAPLGVVNTDEQGWTLDPATQMAVNAIIDLPPEFTVANIYALIGAAAASGLTASTNVVRLEISAAGLIDPTGLFTGDPTVQASSSAVTAPAPAVLATKSGTISNSAAWNTHPELLTAVPVAVPTARPLVVRLRRVAADALDTFAGNAYLLGLIFERVQ